MLRSCRPPSLPSCMRAQHSISLMRCAVICVAPVLAIGIPIAAMRSAFTCPERQVGAKADARDRRRHWFARDRGQRHRSARDSERTGAKDFTANVMKTVGDHPVAYLLDMDYDVAFYSRRRFRLYCSRMRTSPSTCCAGKASGRSPTRRAARLSGHHDQQPDQSRRQRPSAAQRKMPLAENSKIPTSTFKTFRRSTPFLATSAVRVVGDFALVVENHRRASSDEYGDHFGIPP